MALIWADGFDHYGTMAQLYNAGWQQQYNPQSLDTSANRRTGTASLSFGANGDTALKRIIAAGKRAIVGAAFWDPYYSNNNACQFGHWFWNGTNWYGAVIYNDGALALFKDGTQLAVTAAGVIVLNTYNYLEFAMTSHASAGTLEMRRNGVVVHLLTGLNTTGGDITQYWLGSRPYSTPYNVVNGRLVDDIYINDASGAENNDFNGDIRCRTFVPVANGPLQDFTVTGAGSAFQALDNVPWVAGQYVSTPTPGAKSNFSKAALPINTAYICGVNVMIAASKTDAGACEMRTALLGSDGATVANGPSNTMGTGTAYYSGQFQVDPATGTLFDRARFDSALMQFERTV